MARPRDDEPLWERGSRVGLSGRSMPGFHVTQGFNGNGWGQALTIHSCVQSAGTHPGLSKTEF